MVISEKLFPPKKSTAVPVSIDTAQPLFNITLCFLIPALREPDDLDAHDALGGGF